MFFISSCPSWDVLYIQRGVSLCVTVFVFSEHRPFGCVFRTMCSVLILCVLCAAQAPLPAREGQGGPSRLSHLTQGLHAKLKSISLHFPLHLNGLRSAAHIPSLGAQEH